MIVNSISINILFSFPGIIAFVELIYLLPVFPTLAKVFFISRKSIYTIRNRSISDHWKEKALLKYSLQILGESFLILFYIFISTIAFGLFFYGTALAFGETYDMILRRIVSLESTLTIIVFGTLYLYVRKNLFRRDSKKEFASYSPYSKILHYIAFNRLVREISSDIDSIFFLGKDVLSSASPPVYVTGLPRSGTTILLEALYSTGEFSALTYRSMPFILAPFIWYRITAWNRRYQDKKERAHKDRLLINYDSPEALEEVFWRTYLPNRYIGKNKLLFHDVDEDIIKKYRNYVNRILLANNNNPHRYLAKNNNNILRIGAIKRAFPDAVLIVPFREPISHASSLFQQHKHFRKIHNSDRFSRRYMRWLAHHEFGLDMKPFHVSDDALPRTGKEPETLDYWLRYWGLVYGNILKNYEKNVYFLDYNVLCNEPKHVLSKLEEILSIRGGKLAQFSDKIKPARSHELSILQHHPKTISKIHKMLKEKAFHN